MYANFHAQSFNYLWSKNQTIPEGIELIKSPHLMDFNLDYSFESLERVDSFIDICRKINNVTEIELTNNLKIQNTLYMLAFYSGEVIGRTLNTAPLWLERNFISKIELDPEILIKQRLFCSFDSEYLNTDVVDIFHVLVHRILNNKASIHKTSLTLINDDFLKTINQSLSLPEIIPSHNINHINEFKKLPLKQKKRIMYLRTKRTCTNFVGIGA